MSSHEDGKKLSECEEYRSVLVMDLSRDETERGRGTEGKHTEAERRENTEREASGVNSMVTEKRSLTVVWKNVRKMISRARPSEIMYWIEISNWHVCAVNETGLTVEEYMEVSGGYSWFAQK